MMGAASAHDQNTRALRAALTLAVAAALLTGLYGRFKGIGTWPLGVDEFYISRSVDNILRTGLPAFPCGGYYTRGLIYQYVVAGLRLCGWSPEYAGRFVAAVSSLMLLPAAWLLGKRVHSSLAGWLTVIVLCVSVWEIEMARFGRMYAPFQALFAWYVLAYVRYATTRQVAALAWMIVLSSLGVLVWEGGVLLGVANLFAVLGASEDGKLRRKDWLQLAGLSILLVLLYLVTRDLRVFADAPAAAGAVDAPHERGRELRVWFAPLWAYPAWGVALAVPFALAVSALRRIAAHRERGLVAAGLCLVMVAAALHAFLAGAGILVLMLLLRMMDYRALSWQAARHFWWTIGAFFLFWFVADAFTYGPALHKLAGSTPQAGDLELIHQLIGFPAVYDHVLRPWLRTMPILSLGVFAALAYLCAMSIIGERRAATAARPLGESPDPIAVLSSLVIVLLLAVGATPTDRIETRYTFFLYPVLMVLAVCALLRVGRSSAAGRRLPLLATASVPLLCFGATEDFQPRHIAEVDSARINFRVGMPAHRREHYYPRNDIRGAGLWLATQVRPGDAVITGIPSLDEYYAHIDYFFLDEGDARYEAYVCPDDRTERWTNLPVLYSRAALKPIVAANRRVFASVFVSAERWLYDYAAEAGWSVTRVWTADSGTAAVLLIEARPAAAPAP
jgi:Dolichyl-phosphate-mannose-protein mannosyltransferase